MGLTQILAYVLRQDLSGHGPQVRSKQENKMHKLHVFPDRISRRNERHLRGSTQFLVLPNTCALASLVGGCEWRRRILDLDLMSQNKIGQSHASSDSIQIRQGFYAFLKEPRV